MNTGHPHINSLWADLIIEELVRNGIDFFCLSPGSRSTPLVAAVATHPQAKSLMHFDERGAAFCALGYARATGRPAVVICTSGTAAANYCPAIVEASADHLPMLVLTADRPPELRATAANQTIDQVKMYGDYSRWFFELPCPDRAVPPRVVLTTIDQAVYRTAQRPAGPVHLNLPFREPLAPIGPEEDFGSYLADTERWRATNAPLTRYHQPTTVCEPARLEDAAQLVNAAERGLIVVGRLRDAEDQAAITKVARALGWPVLADIGSGLRSRDRNSLTVPYADHVLCSDSFADAHAPDTVLHFGPPVTSKRIWQWLSSSRPQTYIHIADHPERQDPEHRITHRYDSDIEMFCNFLLPFVTGKPRTAFRDSWHAAAARAAAAIEQALRQDNSLSEPFIARTVTQCAAVDSCLFVASSMPIRDIDMFADPDGVSVPLGANRGASGIDGTVASAVGFSLGHNKRCTLLIGDLALLHDLNSLALVNRSARPMTIVAVNNDGGGIFSFLPISRRTDLFEPYWGTPHGLSFEHAAAMFGLRHTRATTPAEFERAYRESQTSDRSQLIEIHTNRDANFRLHNTITAGVADALDR